MTKDNWEIVGTIATVMATLVALVIPFIMDHLAKCDRNQERKMAVEEVCHAVDRAVHCYIKVRNMLQANDALKQSTRFRQFSVEVTAVGDALLLMMAREGLSDGVLICGSAAARLCNGVAEAAETASQQKPDNASPHIESLWNLAQFALGRAERVRKYHKLNRRDGEEIPCF